MTTATTAPDAGEDTAASVQETEARRLAALRGYGILDTPPAPGFDALASLAAQLCDAPTGLITFVDEHRQFFKARAGHGSGHGSGHENACEGGPDAPLDAGFCPYVVRAGEPVVIPDTRADPAFADNPAARNGSVRFYAGVPLLTEDGQALGTLCVLDPAPRPGGLAPAQLGALRALAGQAMTQLAQARGALARDAALADREEAIRQQEVLIATQAEVVAAGDLEAMLDAVVGGAMAALPQAEGGVIQLASGDHLEYVAVRGTLVRHRGLAVPLRGSLAGHCWRTRRPMRVPDVLADPHVKQDLVKGLDLRSCVLAPIQRNGAVVAVLKLQSSRLDAFSEHDLQTARAFAGTATAGLAEIGEAWARRAERESGTRYRAIFDSATDIAIIATDREGRVTDWNSGAARVLGWSAEAMQGVTVERIFTPEDRDAGQATAEMRLSLRDGRMNDARWHLRRNGERFFASGEMMPLRDADGLHIGFVKVLRDRTADHLADLALRETEARLRRAQEAGGVGVFAIDITAGTLHATPEFCRLYGVPERESHPAETFEHRVIDEDRHLVSTDAARFAGQAPRDVEYRVRLPETGALRWIARKGEIERDAAGRPVRFVGAARDITEQVRVREALRAEREQLAQMFEQAPTFMALLRGPEHRIERVNPGYLRLIGERDVVGRTVAEALPDAVAQGFLDLLDGVYRGGEAFTAEGSRYAVQALPGGPVDERTVDVVYQPIRDAAGAVSGILVEGVDVTERRRAQAALAAQEARYRTLFDTMDEGFCIIEFIDGPHGPSSDYVHVEANPGYERQTGIPDIVGKRLREIVAEEADGWVELYGGVLRTGVPVHFERAFVAVGRHIEVSAARIEPADRRQVSVLFRDITERKRTEAALRESEAQFRAFAQAVPNHVWASRPDGYLYWFNVQAYAYAGAEPGTLHGLTAWSQLLHPDDLPRAAAAWTHALGSGEIYETEFRIRRLDGIHRWFLVRAEPVRGVDGAILRWVGTNTDIDERRRQAEELVLLNATLEQRVATRTEELMLAEAALRQSQKMEAVGQLTGGLAHDFNNLLAGISGALELMQSRLAQGRLTELDRYMGAAQGAAKRAAALTHRLLAFSRRQTLDPKPTDVNRLVAGMEELIRRTVGPAITVEVVQAPDLWPTLVDPPQLENALLNLCINARDAMPEGGRITIETGNCRLDAPAAQERDLEPGQYLSLRVTDTGTGMSPEVVAKAFDPFFTTKPMGEGTGLGLSMIYGFAKQSGGQVGIDSKLGQGTTVCLYLPRHEGDVDRDAAEREREPVDRAGAGETVLVVDDEPTVRMLVTEVLEDLGYTAIEAGDSAAGLRVLRSDARIDLLVTDVGLPGGMNGRQMADAGREARPGLRVLFITGYAENAALNHGHLAPGMQVLTKPFAVDALAGRIRALIEGRD